MIILANKRCGKRVDDGIYLGGGEGKRVVKETGIESTKLLGGAGKAVGLLGSGGGNLLGHWQKNRRENPAFCGQSDFGHTSMQFLLIYFTRAICSMALVAVG